MFYSYIHYPAQELKRSLIVNSLYHKFRGTKTPIVIDEYEYITCCNKIDKGLPLPNSINDIRDYDTYQPTPVWLGCPL